MKKKNFNECLLIIGVLVGGVLGFCVGFAFDSIALYTAIGLFFGLIIGIAMANKEDASRISVIREEKKPAVKKTTTKKTTAKKPATKKTTTKKPATKKTTKK